MSSFIIQIVFPKKFPYIRKTSKKRRTLKKSYGQSFVHPTDSLFNLPPIPIAFFCAGMRGKKIVMFKNLFVFKRFKTFPFDTEAWIYGGEMMPFIAQEKKQKASIAKESVETEKPYSLSKTYYFHNKNRRNHRHAFQF